MQRTAVIAFVLCSALGCSISNSIQSSSDSSNTGSRSSNTSSESSSNSFDSSSNSSESSSDSSSGASDPAEQAYHDDVRDYTANTLVAVGGFGGLRLDAFQKGLSAVARRHGVSSWQVRRSTWHGMGAGFARARATQAELDGLKRSLAATRSADRLALQDGFESVL